MGKLGKKNDEEEEPATERRREYTNLGEIGSKGNVRGVSTGREVMGKSKYVRVIEKEVRRDDPIEYFLPTGVGSTF